MKYLEENNDNNDNDNNNKKDKAEHTRIFALYIFSIITIITIILFFINNKFYDKLYLLICIIIQVLTLVSLYFDYTYFLNFLSKFFAILIVCGVLFIKTKIILLTILCILFITLITRKYFKTCLFYYWDKSEYNIISDIGYLLLLILNLYKILYLK